MVNDEPRYTNVTPQGASNSSAIAASSTQNHGLEVGDSFELPFGNRIIKVIYGGPKETAEPQISHLSDISDPDSEEIALAKLKGQPRLSAVPNPISIEDKFPIEECYQYEGTLGPYLTLDQIRANEESRTIPYCSSYVDLPTPISPLNTMPVAKEDRAKPGTDEELNFDLDLPSIPPEPEEERPSFGGNVQDEDFSDHSAELEATVAADEKKLKLDTFLTERVSFLTKRNDKNRTNDPDGIAQAILGWGTYDGSYAVVDEPSDDGDSF